MLVMNWQACQALTQGWDKLLFTAGAFVVLTFTKIKSAIVILVTVILGSILYH
jgi:hypothetical protein